jgi:hypothetical protein
VLSKHLAMVALLQVVSCTSPDAPLPPSLPALKVEAQPSPPAAVEAVPKPAKLALRPIEPAVSWPAAPAKAAPMKLRDRQCARARSRLAHAQSAVFFVHVKVDPGQTNKEAQQRVMRLLPPKERPTYTYDTSDFTASVSARGLAALCASPWVVRLDRADSSISPQLSSGW